MDRDARPREATAWNCSWPALGAASFTSVIPGALSVSRLPAELTWGAFDGDVVAGQVNAWLRPDGRCFVYFDTWQSAAYQPLADAVARDLSRDLYVSLEDTEFDALDACAAAGFAEHRRESYFRIPTNLAASGLAGVTLSDELDLLSAADADIGRLRLLDDALEAGRARRRRLALGPRRIPCRNVWAVLRPGHVPRRGSARERRVRRAGPGVDEPRRAACSALSRCCSPTEGAEPRGRC